MLETREGFIQGQDLLGPRLDGGEFLVEADPLTLAAALEPVMCRNSIIEFLT